MLIIAMCTGTSYTQHFHSFCFNINFFWCSRCLYAKYLYALMNSKGRSPHEVTKIRQQLQYVRRFPYHESNAPLIGQGAKSSALITQPVSQRSLCILTERMYLLYTRALTAAPHHHHSQHQHHLNPSLFK